MQGQEVEEDRQPFNSPTQNSLAEFTFLSFKDLRLQFIRKVYGIFAAQIVLTAIFIFLTLRSSSIQSFMSVNAFLFPLSIVFGLGCLYALICYTHLNRTVPTNYILLFSFTLCEMYTIAYVCKDYDPLTVMVAALLTAVVATALTLYAIFTKTDFTTMSAALFVGLSLLIVASIIAIFVKIPLLNLVLSVIGTFLFGIYLIMDTQLILGTKSLHYTKDDYIMASLNLYLDIINLFLDLLGIIGKVKG